MVEVLRLARELQAVGGGEYEDGADIADDMTGFVVSDDSDDGEVSEAGSESSDRDVRELSDRETDEDGDEDKIPYQDSSSGSESGEEDDE